MVAVAHLPGAEVALLGASLAGRGGLVSLLLPEGLDPRRGQPPIRQPAEDAVRGARRRGCKPARLVGGEHAKPGRGRGRGRGRGTPSRPAARGHKVRRRAGGPQVGSAGHVQIAMALRRRSQQQRVRVLSATGAAEGRCFRPRLPGSTAQREAARCDVGLSLSERRLSARGKPAPAITDGFAVDTCV